MATKLKMSFVSIHKPLRSLTAENFRQLLCIQMLVVLFQHAFYCKFIFGTQDTCLHHAYPLISIVVVSWNYFFQHDFVQSICVVLILFQQHPHFQKHRQIASHLHHDHKLQATIHREYCSLEHHS